MLTNCDPTQTIYIIGTEIYAHELAAMVRYDSLGSVECVSREQFLELPPDSQCMLGFKNMAYRKDFLATAPVSQYRWPTFVHDSTVVIDKPRLWQPGIVVGPLSMIGYRAVIQQFCDIGPMCLIGHGVELDTNTVACNSVHIGGSTKIGKNVFLGQMCSIKTKVTITNDCFISMNGVVTKNITEPGNYIGTPVRKKSTS